MISLSLEKIVGKIVEATDLDKSAVMRKVNAKKKNLSNLVSDEGAAHIVANELGVTLVSSNKQGRVLIKNLAPGLRNITLMGRVLNVNEPKVFDRKDGKGKVKVGSVFVQDESGKTRVTFWNEQNKVLEDKTISPGDIVKFFYAYVKEGRKGYPEVHLSSSSKFLLNPKEDPDFDKIPEKGESPNYRSRGERVRVADLSEGRFEVMATLVNIYSPRFYDACPECNSKVEGNRCSNHGEVKPNLSGFVSAVLDDGSGNIRCTFFRDEAEKLLGAKLAELKESDDLFEEAKKSLLGSQVVVYGKVKKNERFDNLDMVAYSSSKPDFAEEAEKALRTTS